MIATLFTDWQKKPSSDLARFPTAAPALVAIRTYVLAEFGGKNLGLHGVRETRAGGKLSSHSFGAAWDWSYRGLDRTVADRVIKFVIDHSAELGVQAVHDYQRSRVWRANRSGDSQGGWKAQRRDRFGMGQAWADWLHIEVNDRQWKDGRSVAEKIGPPPRPVLRRGDRGEQVRLVQMVLRDKANQSVAVDGRFGVQTEMAVRNVEAFLGVDRPDGVVDAEFWKIIDQLVKQ